MRSGLLLVLALYGICRGAQLRALPEFFRPDPFGGVVESDRHGAQWWDSIKLTAARGGYASCHLVANAGPNEAYDLTVDFPLTIDLFREWFHFNTPDKRYYPDALVPVRSPVHSHLPEPYNQVADQTAQAYWVDIWIPASTRPGWYRGTARLTSAGKQSVLPIALEVLSARVPEKDAVTLDNNSYGTSWMLSQYPKTLAPGADQEYKLFSLIQEHHRIFYEHRGVFHQLGYGHAGKVGPEFAPELGGTGRRKHVTSWNLFDRHYGPLLDGSAFQNSRRGPKPIPFVYLPVNPEWPASFLWWGEPGYEAEFVNVLSEMEQHFRQKGWTHTNFEVFFNHKKRYKGFAWDGDEIRFSRDNSYLAEYRRMLDLAVPLGSPVHFVMRADSSWTMNQQFELLKGIVSFWVLGEGEFGWYSDALRELKKRGDIVWTYGGTPPVQKIPAAMTLNPLRSWITGVDGFVRWQTVSPGPDPWYRLDGGGETLIYSGERFGLSQPLASIRLKLQRNCLQDMALLEAASQNGSRERIQAEVVNRYNGTALADWRNTGSPLASKPVLDWNNADFEDALKPFEARFANLDPGAWGRVHEVALHWSGLQ